MLINGKFNVSVFLRCVFCSNENLSEKNAKNGGRLEALNIKLNAIDTENDDMIAEQQRMTALRKTGKDAHQQKLEVGKSSTFQSKSKMDFIFLNKQSTACDQISNGSFFTGMDPGSRENQIRI